MGPKAQYDWPKIKKAYENNRDLTIKKFAEVNKVNYKTLQYRIHKEGWISPRSLSTQARTLAKQNERARETRDEIIEKAAVDLNDSWDQMREEAFAVVEKAVAQFKTEQKSGNKTPKDFHELKKAIEIAEKMAGKEKEGAGNGAAVLPLNLTLLSSRTTLDTGDPIDV